MFFFTNGQTMIVMTITSLACVCTHIYKYNNKIERVITLKKLQLLVWTTITIVQQQWQLWDQQQQKQQHTHAFTWTHATQWWHYSLLKLWIWWCLYVCMYTCSTATRTSSNLDLSSRHGSCWTWITDYKSRLKRVAWVAD